MSNVILTINPGSTSTKMAVYRGATCLFQHTGSHPTTELKTFPTVVAQYDYRTTFIKAKLAEENLALSDLDAVVGRGGLLAPMASGTYTINEQMISDLRTATYGEHASNLGALMAHRISELHSIPAFIVDPVVVDELQPIARISGHARIKRKSIFHALNHKAAGRKVAKRIGVAYEQKKWVIAHLGGGISVGAHRNGQVIDVNNALDGDGPFSPERSGGLPMMQTVALANELPSTAFYRQLVGQGGVVSYLGTNDLRVVEQRVMAAENEAVVVFEAMAYQVSKEIGACAVVLDGEVDGVILTGGLANSALFTAMISKKCQWLAPIYIEPGEDELEALNEGAQRVLNGDEQAKTYEGGRLDGK